MKVLFDTSVLVAAMVEAHPAHAAARVAFDRAVSGRAPWAVAVHSLAELYSVLTTLPVRRRISPTQARRLIQENVERSAALVSLSATDYQATLRALSEAELSGGVTYDAIIVRAAETWGADRLLTLNVADFHRIATRPDMVTSP